MKSNQFSQKKNDNIFHLIRIDHLTVTHKIVKWTKMRLGKIKADTPEPQTHVIPEVGKTGKSDIRMARTDTHRYNTRSSTKRVNHVTTFKNTPNMYKMNTIDTLRTYIGTYYIARTDPKKYTTTVEPLSKHRHSS